MLPGEHLISILVATCINYIQKESFQIPEHSIFCLYFCSFIGGEYIFGMTRRKRFHIRSFISFALFISTVWIIISGTVLYIAPPGRIAHWQFWTFFGFDKDQWQAQHTLFSYLFMVLAVIHLFTLNWRNFWSYIKLKRRKGFRKSKEFTWAFLVMLLFFIGTTYEIPPFSSFFKLGESIGKTWEDTELKGPVPYLENLTLENIANQYLDHNITEVIEGLRAQKVIVKDKTQVLKDIARDNDLSPAQIFALITDSEVKKD